MKTKTKLNITTGPWEISEETAVHSYISQHSSSGGQTIAKVWFQGTTFDKSDAMAIAAVPDLVQFALRMREYFRHNPDGYQDLREICESVLAKVEGDI